MADWQEIVDPTSNQTYYYNAATGETSWTKPVTQSADAGSAWQELADPTTGHKYYYNSITQETSWEKPAALSAAVPAPVQAATPTIPSSPSKQASVAAAANLLPARTSRGTLAVARKSVIPGAGKKTVRAAQSLDEQLASRARKFIQQRRLERYGNKTSAFGALSRRRGVSVAGDVARAEGGDAAAASSEWQEVVHAESGQKYYYNSTTGETSWEKPK